MQEKNKTRLSNFEILRIISMILIVTFHCVYHSNLTFDTNSFSFNKIIHDFFYMFGELGVNCFALISGYFLVNSSFKKKKLCNLFFEVEFYNIILLLLAIGIGYITTISGILTLLTPLLLNKYWFVTAYILLYIFSPYINKLIHALTQRELKDFILISLLFFSIIPTFFTWFYFEENFECFFFYNRFIWLIVVYFIAAYIRLYGSIFKINSQQVAVKYFVLTTIGILCFIVGIDILLTKGKTGLLPATYFWYPNSIIMVFWSISLFQIFHYTEIKTIPWVNKIASGTFGVYLLHAGILYDWIWNDVFKIGTYASSSYFLLYVLLSVTIVFIIGICIDFIRQRIFKILHF